MDPLRNQLDRVMTGLMVIQHVKEYLGLLEFCPHFQTVQLGQEALKLCYKSE